MPRLLEVKADGDGKIMVTVIRTTMETITVGGGAAPAIAIAPGGGAAGAPPVPVPAPPAGGTREVPVTKAMTVELGDVKDLKITTADGKKVDVADAVKQLKDGAVVVVSADGKPVNPNFLKVFKDDVLVLTAPELAAFPGVGPQPFPGGIRPRPPIRPRPAPLPAQPLPGVIQIQPVPGVIQIQPGVIQLVPLNPAPAPAPAPAK
jgi:hypothetical protein